MDPDKAKFETGHFVSMEKYLQMSLEPVRNKMDDISSAIEKLSISTTEHEHMKYQVASQSELIKEFEGAIEELQEKVTRLEHFRRIMAWIGGILTALGLGLASRYIDLFFP